MKKGLIGIVGLLGIVWMSCGNPTAEEMASLAAKGYYQHLINGEYEQFLRGKDGLDKGSEEQYWSQLVDNCHQFIRQQEQAHRGIHELRVVKYTNVFMMLCFGDSTNEEIVVPMVERDGRWYMR